MSDSKNQYTRQRISSQVEMDLDLETPQFQDPKSNNKFNILTKSEFFDNFSSGYRKQIIQDNLTNLAKLQKQNEKMISPQKKEFYDDQHTSQINEISLLKKDNLHQQLKIQELESLKIILEDQIGQKNQSILNQEQKQEKENQRLRDEIDTLRQKNYSMEFEHKNTQDSVLQLKKQNQLEIESIKDQNLHQQELILNKEIRELTSKHNNEKLVLQQDIMRLKENVQLYGSQINGLNNTTQQQDELIQKLRKVEIKSIEDLEHEQNKLKDEYKETVTIFKQIQNELEQKNQIQFKEIEKLCVFQNKCQDLESLTNELNQDIDNSNKNIQEIKQKYDLLNQQYEKTQNHLKIAEKTISQLEDTANYMNLELDREKQNLLETQENHQDQKKKTAQLEFKCQDLQIFQQRCKEQEQKITHLYQDIQQYKQQQRDQDQNLSQKLYVIQQQENQLCNHEKKIMNIENENDRLLLVIQNKQHDIDNINQDLNHFKQFQLVCKEQEAQLDLLVAEIDRLNRLLMEHITENDNLNIKIDDLNRFVQKFREKEIEVQQLENEIQNLMQKTSQMTKLQYTLNDQEQRLHQLNQENNHLSTTMNNKQKDLQVSNYKFSELEQICYQLRQDVGQIQNLSEEIDRLTQIIKERDFELEKQQDQIDELSGLNKQVQEHLALFVLLFAELEGLRKRNDQKDYELEILRKSHMVGYLKR